MAKDQSKRLKPSVFKADDSAIAAFKSISEYAPLNPAFAKDAVTIVRDEVSALREVEAVAVAEAMAARKAAVAKEWEFHNLMLGVKAQIIAQFGLDSDELASMGRKKKSEYKPPGRKSAKK